MICCGTTINIVVADFFPEINHFSADLSETGIANNHVKQLLARQTKQAKALCWSIVHLHGQAR